MKVLVVEDSKIALNALESLLRRLPEVREFRVAEFIAEARQVCRAFTPDIAVIDMLLPDGNGLEVISTIRCANPKVQIGILSHYADFHRDLALQAGADLFLDKSADIEPTLATWIHGVATEKRLADAR